MGVVAVMLAVIAGGLVWNRALRNLADRRGRELYREQVAHAVAEFKTDERTRLAVELHDSIAQNLTAISFQIASARSSRKISPEASEQHMQNADRMLHSCRTELRRCLWDLRNNTLEERDFREAIDKTISPVLGDAVPHIRFPVPRARISDTTAHAALSIIRELTFNAVLHGRARNVWIAGEICERTLRFSVRDDGCGFDVAHHPGQSTGHFGLKGISERLQALDGELSMSSSSHGTRAVVSIHLPKPEGISS
jgi:signal transduction histidine kinase